MVLVDKAMVMTDGRYTIQIKQQVDPALFEICDMADVTVGDWLAKHVREGQVIGFDPKLHTKKQMDTIRDKMDGLGVHFKSLSLI